MDHCHHLISPLLILTVLFVSDLLEVDEPDSIPLKLLDTQLHLLSLVLVLFLSQRKTSQVVSAFLDDPHGLHIDLIHLLGALLLSLISSTHGRSLLVDQILEHGPEHCHDALDSVVLP